MIISALKDRAIKDRAIKDRAIKRAPIALIARPYLPRSSGRGQK